MLLIFDMDGTVLDSMGALQDAAKNLIASHYDVSIEKAAELYHYTVGAPFREQLEILFPQNAQNEHVARVYEKTHEVLCADAELSPGIGAMLWAAHWARHQLALVTSTDQHLISNHLPQVRALPWNFIGGYREGYTKDDQIRRVLTTFRYSGTTVLFGDAESDRRCAARAGIEFFLVEPNRISAVVREVLRRNRA